MTRWFPDDTLLRRALGANAIFSAASGLLLVVGAILPGGLPGAPPPAFLLTLGVGLLLFALAVGWVSRDAPVDPVRAALVTLADLAWVAGSGIVLAGWVDRIPPPTPVALIGVAGVVLLLALAQLRGLHRYSRNRTGRTDARSAFALTESVPAPPERVWARLRELDGIGDYMQELASVAVDSVDGRTVRTCSDHTPRALGTPPKVIETPANAILADPIRSNYDPSRRNDPG